ncbi:alpha-amylase B-like [Lytechinus variegatus]|uniref:alpha-amylase B-like n=1 Tax=Lytechinus variegatus TaxID=7654 RepID=UPI001BB26FEC|nr:alpha-amylase B-like [Lytechinus variegatus]
MLQIAVLLLATACANAGFSDPNFVGDRQVIVHLFEWKWTDIARECREYLGPHGFAGVQVSPPMGHREFGDVPTPYPWWQRYQPVNYTLESRSGTEAEFRDMVATCNENGVRIYVDAVINHMAVDDSYTFEAVPYYPPNFNVPNGKCNTTSGNIESYQDAYQVRKCNLVGLCDLDHCNLDTRTKVQEYLNRALSYGVAGFRFDAAKHMCPGQISKILSGLQDCKFGGSPYLYQEVIDRGGEPIKSSDYTHLGDVTEFKYCGYIAGIADGSFDLRSLKDFATEMGMLESSSAFVFVDNHDNQRGHGGAGNEILSFQKPKFYKMAVAFTLANNYGTTRIMSSYKFNNTDQGPPSNNGKDTKSPEFNSDSTCKGNWVCEHRWPEFRNMVRFRNIAGTAPVTWTYESSTFIAFSRGNKAFFALSTGESQECRRILTNLDPGTYCDLISGESSGQVCTGKVITVDGSRFANICLGGEDSMVAITV